MKVYSIGSHVRIGDNIMATVLEVCIKSRAVQYRVVWWNKNTRNTEWLDASEVIPADGRETTQIGFTTNGGE